MQSIDPTRYRPPQSDAEREALRRSTRIAFRAGDADGIDRFIGLHDPENLRVLIGEGGAVEGALVRMPMAHFFAGARVATLGIAAVSVPPEIRGSGAGATLMRAAILEAHREGTPLATLFASTQSLYRRAGFEQAGHFCRFSIPLASIGRREREPRVRPATEADRPAIRDCYAEMARHVHGALDRSEPLWRRAFYNDTTACDVVVVTEQIDGVERITGALSYRIDPSVGDFRGQTLWIHDVSFTTPAAGRRLLSYLARCGPIARDAILQCGPASPLLLMLAENTYRCTTIEHWLMRVVDVRRALEARAYAPQLSTRFALEIRDDLVDANNARFEVSIGDGRASVSPGAGDALPRLTMDVTALAPLYTGFLSARALRLAGVIEASDEAVGAAAPAFAGPAPCMMNMF